MDVADFGKLSEQDALQKLTATSGMAIVPEEDAQSGLFDEETLEQVTVPAQEKIDAVGEEPLEQQQDLARPLEQQSNTMSEQKSADLALHFDIDVACNQILPAPELVETISEVPQETLQAKQVEQEIVRKPKTSRTPAESPLEIL
jgi:hypothetical protein